MEIPIFSPTSIPKGSSWKRWLVTLTIGISLGTVFFYYREPILAYTSTAWTWLSTAFSGLTSLPFFNNLLAWIQQNPLQTIGGIASIGTALFAVIRYYSEAKAKTAAITAQLQSQTNLQNYQGQFQEYITQKETQIQQLQSQVNAKGSDSLQSALSESQALVTTQAQQIRDLRIELEHANYLVLTKETKIVEKPKVL